MLSGRIACWLFLPVTMGRVRLPVRLVWYETYEDRHEALSREWHLKRMSREQKLKLITGTAEGKKKPDRE